VVDSSASWPRNVDSLFFMPSWAQCGFHKKWAGTCYAEVMFLHEVESAGHIGHFGKSRVRNVDATIFMLE
jgi:hypothetical protein